jgi:uncharacterized membrane protein YkvA (DUF1232 family)
MGIADKISGKKVSQTRFFKKAKEKAIELAKDPDKLRDLVKKAQEKAKDKKSGPIGEVWDSLMKCFRLIVAYAKGEYREIPWKSLITIIGSVVYFLMPIDFIPDFILSIGLIDDMVLIRWAVKSIAKDLEHFSNWEQGKAPESSSGAGVDKAPGMGVEPQEQ